MLETVAVAFTTLFATIDPIAGAAIFAAVTPGASPAARRRMAVRGVAIATALLLLFAFFGQGMLSLLGISVPALRIAGGLLLLLMGIDMVFARGGGATAPTDDETREAAAKADVSVFPLATPLLAGPGAMGLMILLMANAGDDLVLQAAVIGSMLGVMVIAIVLLLVAGTVARVLGVTGLHVVTRVFGVLLTALAVQFVVDGLNDFGIINMPVSVLGATAAGLA